MRDPKRIKKVIKALKKRWKKNPELRLGQLLFLVANNNNLFYLEDKELLNRLTKK